MNKTKESTFRLYNRWRKQQIYCPAFKQNVKFTLKGWRHITGATWSKKRNYKDIYRRLRLLPYVKKIVQESVTIQKVVERNSKTYYALENIVNINKSKKSTTHKIKVIFEEDRKGQKIFLSVMSTKMKQKK